MNLLELSQERSRGWHFESGRLGRWFDRLVGAVAERFCIFGKSDRCGDDRLVGAIGR